MEGFRIAELRTALNISQEELGNKIGLSRSGISNIEKCKRTLNDRHIKLICTEFNVNENWLRTGEGPMFRETPSATIDKLAQEFGLDDLDKKILDTYIQLSAQHRAVLKSWLADLARQLIPSPLAGDQIEIDQEVESYRRELQAEKKQKTSFPSAASGED